MYMLRLCSYLLKLSNKLGFGAPHSEGGTLAETCRQAPPHLWSLQSSIVRVTVQSQHSLSLCIASVPALVTVQGQHTKAGTVTSMQKSFVQRAFCRVSKNPRQQPNEMTHFGSMVCEPCWSPKSILVGWQLGGVISKAGTGPQFVLFFSSKMQDGSQIIWPTDTQQCVKCARDTMSILAGWQLGGVILKAGTGLNGMCPPRNVLKCAVKGSVAWSCCSSFASVLMSGSYPQLPAILLQAPILCSQLDSSRVLRSQLFQTAWTPILCDIHVGVTLHCSAPVNLGPCCTGCEPVHAFILNCAESSPAFKWFSPDFIVNEFKPSSRRHRNQHQGKRYCTESSLLTDFLPTSQRNIYQTFPASPKFAGSCLTSHFDGRSEHRKLCQHWRSENANFEIIHPMHKNLACFFFFKCQTSRLHSESRMVQKG